MREPARGFLYLGQGFRQTEERIKRQAARLAGGAGNKFEQRGTFGPLRGNRERPARAAAGNTPATQHRGHRAGRIDARKHIAKIRRMALGRAQHLQAPRPFDAGKLIAQPLGSGVQHRAGRSG